jgi:hypothetical protein
MVPQKKKNGKRSIVILILSKCVDFTSRALRETINATLCTLKRSTYIYEVQYLRLKRPTFLRNLFYYFMPAIFSRVRFGTAFKLLILKERNLAKEASDLLPDWISFASNFALHFRNENLYFMTQIQRPCKSISRTAWKIFWFYEIRGSVMSHDHGTVPGVRKIQSTLSYDTSHRIWLNLCPYFMMWEHGPHPWKQRTNL